MVLPVTALADATPITPEPGPKTTEFWQALLTNLIAATVAIGSLVGAHFSATGLQALVAPIAVIAATVTTAFYARSRSAVKQAAHAANANVQIAAIHAFPKL
jgi:hypothetical protein